MTARETSVPEILAQVKISEEWRELGGPKLRGGPVNFRGQRFWCKPDGYSVSLNDARGVWHDFVTGEGGGALDLVAHVRGGSRADALRWCAELAGVPLSDTPLSPEERARWAAERRDLERDLPEARYWRRAAALLTEETLNDLKSRFFDPMAGDKPASSELQYFTRLLARLERLEGRGLVSEYREWCEHSPGITGALVRWARRREAAERRALLAYLRATDPRRRAA